MARIRFDTAQFRYGQAGLGQDIDDLVIEADPFNRTAAIDEEDFLPKSCRFFTEVS